MKLFDKLREWLLQLTTFDENEYPQDELNVLMPGDEVYAELKVIKSLEPHKTCWFKCKYSRSFFIRFDGDMDEYPCHHIVPASRFLPGASDEYNKGQSVV